MAVEMTILGGECMKELKVEMNFYMPLKDNETEEGAIERFNKEFADKDIQVWDYEVREN